MNYAFLAKKYLGVNCLFEDRTYEGLIWPADKGEKPLHEVFEGFQREEEREARAAGHAEAEQDNLTQERQRQARAQAVEDARPFADKLQEQYQALRNAARDELVKAIECQELLKTKTVVEECWHEITKAQEVINENAQQYLHDTDWYVTRAREPGGKDVPIEVLQLRAEARDRIQKGQLVFARWQELRASELPSKEDIAAAIREGGRALEEMRKACHAVALKYPKPKKQLY